MELHHNWKVYAEGPAFLVGAVVALFSPQLLDMLGYEFTFGDWVGYAGAVVLFLAGVLAVVQARRPLQVVLDGEGISWRKDGRPLRLAWADAVRVTVEKAPNSGAKARPTLLTVWTPAALDGVEPDVPLEGLAGYRLADLTKVSEPAAEVEGALRRYAGGLYQGAGR